MSSESSLLSFLYLYTLIIEGVATGEPVGEDALLSALISFKYFHNIEGALILVGEDALLSLC